MNRRELATEVSKRDLGPKVNLKIAQIQKIIKHTLDVLKEQGYAVMPLAKKKK